MNTNPRLPTSKHFRIEQMTEGVYAAIHIDGGGAFCNAGIVDLGNRTLIYDTLYTPQAAEDLRDAARTLTGRPACMIINSHYHYDHIWGNQVFSDNADIITTEETYQLILATKGHDDYDNFVGSAEENLESTRLAFQNERDEGQRRQIKVWVDFYQSLVETKSILQIRPPNVTFNQCMWIYGRDRSAKLISFSNGHSVSDTILYLPEERIAFMGDLLFIDYHPWIGDCDPECLLQILDEFISLKPELLLSGHGPIGRIDDLERMKEYLTKLSGFAQTLVEHGESEEMIDKLAIPAPFDTWLFTDFFPINMRSLYQRLSK